MEIDFGSLLTWFGGFGGAYAAVEVRIRWLRSDFEKLDIRLTRVEQRQEPRSA